MIGFEFSKFQPSEGKSHFDQLLKLFSELLIYTSGDVPEAISWMNELDREYKLTTSEYGMGDFIEDLKRKGYLVEDDVEQGVLKPGASMERVMRNDAMEEIFGKLKRSGSGNHRSFYEGTGDELNANLRPFQFGDNPEFIAINESLKNAMINSQSLDFNMTHDDLVTHERDMKLQTSTVMLIDISHSMILYGEDRITPAKKVALALSEMIARKYPKDTLDIVVFGDDAWQIEKKDSPYLQVGPFHTNTVAGLSMARDLLRKRKNPNKQIFMITDGKPSCLKEPGGYYKNSFGLDRKIVNKTLNEAAACSRAGIGITTFMIAKDPYLQQFVQQLTESCRGKAFYSGLKGLGEFVFEDYEKNKRRKI
jgi:uncharacterized protein with von Willebrand factor type A (vWA) domain